MKKDAQKKDAKKDVVSMRKACKATGTGLSHYILMDKKTGK
jgi:modified peptide precursor CbpA